MTATTYAWHGQPIELADGDYDLAFWHAREAMARNADTPHNRFWSPLELATHGYLAEIAFQRYLGTEPCVSENPTENAADVGRCQIKSAAWKSSHTMDDWEGGHVYVPLKRQAPYICVISMFGPTLRYRVFYEGWIPSMTARRFPVKAGFRKAHAVPYDSLRTDPLPADAFPESARQRLLEERSRRVLSRLYPNYTDAGATP